MTVLEGMILIVFLTWLVKKVKSEIRNPPHPPFDKGGKEGFIQISNFRKYFSVSLFLCLFVSLFLLSATIGMFVSPNLRAGTLSVPIATLSVAAGVWKAYFIEPILFFIVLISELGNSKLNSQNSTVYNHRPGHFSVLYFYLRHRAKIFRRRYSRAVAGRNACYKHFFVSERGGIIFGAINSFVRLSTNFQLPITNFQQNYKSQISNFKLFGYWVLGIGNFSFFGIYLFR